MTKKKTARKKKAVPRKRKSVGAKYKVYHEVKRVGATINETRGHLRRELEGALKTDLYRREMATTKTDRKKASKAIAEKKKELRAIGGLKHRSARKRK
jgi:hypothetical protein